MKLTLKDFKADEQGRTFADVIEGAPAALTEVLDYISQADAQRRMEDAEDHHDRPALAGVVKSLEQLPHVQKVMNSTDGNFAKRFRQATGAATRIVMEGRGWKKTGQKWSVGVGVFYNKAEHYERPPE